MSPRSRVVVSIAVAVLGVGALALVGALASPSPDPFAPAAADETTTSAATTSTTDTTTSTSIETTSTTGLTGPATTSTTTSTTTVPPSTLVLSETLQLPFLKTPSSPGSSTIEGSPSTGETTGAPTTTVAPPTTAPVTTTTAPGRFARTHDRIVVTGVVEDAPPAVLGPAGAFARAYGMTGGLDGVVSVHGTETVDYTTDTFAQLAGRSSFTGSMRSVGDVALTFLTTIPRSTSFAGDEPAVESGRVTGMKGWRGTITLHYTATEAGNSKGTYRAVFTRTHS